MAWNPDVLTSIANGVMKIQAHLEIEAPRAGNPVLNLTAAQWAGQARGPADNRAAGITRWLKEVADEYGDLAAALNAGAPDIRGAMTALANRTTLADADGYILDRGSRSYTVSFQPSRAPDGAEYDAGTAYEHQTALHNLGAAADTAVTNVRNSVVSALSEIGGITPSSIAVNRGAIDPALAAGDSEAIRNGTATPEQKGRFARAMSLTPDQLAKLQAGQPVDIDPSRLAYIKNALGADPGNSDMTSPAVTAAIAAAQRRGEDIADAYSRPRRSVGQAGMSADDISRLNTLGKTMARGSFVLGAGVTVFDEWSKYDRGEQDGGDATAAVGGALAGGALGGAAAGAVVGSFAGPVGTAIGAGIGAAIGSKAGSDAAKVVKGWFD
ncbi:hypothetical protein [Gordonia sp. OPL2]|uniref:hypothetical protein n=1 Tax=Gordonia sp. OPL2 TaxID=2486274 RepID=UPI0021CC751C|nr:hypothetical protein [Gordonia sp. OPL2]